jgi:23S rRNA (pseudouridine1915-N3)-methyltransferase
MIYRIICAGNIKEKYFTDKIKEYTDKINARHQIEIIQVDDEKIPKNTSDTINRKIVETECEKMKKHINNGEYVIALCIEGKQCNQKEFGEVIRKAAERGCEKVDFVIGGSLGLSDSIIKEADYKLSFSSMTFPHQLMRVMLLDAIYGVCN